MYQVTTPSCECITISTFCVNRGVKRLWPILWPVALDPIICQGIPGRHPPFFDLLPFFFSLSPPIFGAPFCIFCKKGSFPESLFLNKNSNQSLFLDENSNQIDSLILNLIIFILCNGSSIGWVVVAVADASSIGWVAVGVSVAAAVAVLAVQMIAMPLPFDGWWLRWRSKRGCTGIL